MSNSGRRLGWLRKGIAVAVAAAAMLTAPAFAGAPRMNIGALQGEWRNNHNTVHIRTYVCGDQVCGVVTWASDKAQEDAQRGGTEQLRGTQIFREFRPAGDGGYKGKVFVPDLNSTFAGRLSVTPDDKLLGKGCILAGLICKTTTWVRVQ